MLSVRKNLTNYRSFLNWLKSDNVIKISVNEYLSQCSQYSISMTRKQAYIYFKKEYIN